MVEVTQEDREADAARWEKAGFTERAKQTREGKWDGDEDVQLLARHRTTALAAKEAELAAERSKVEKLREALESVPLIASTEHPHSFRCRQDAWLRDVFTPALTETQP